MIITYLIITYNQKCD